MEIKLKWPIHHRLLCLYISITIAISKYIKKISSLFLLPTTILRRTIPINFWFVILAESLLSLYFSHICNLFPSIVDLDESTTIHFWTTTHRRFDKPNLVLIHGYGGNSMWQFVRQVGPLSRRFNLYIPDLVFFGKSYTKQSDRTEEFQARCVCRGLKRLGVDRFSMYAISYGGYVGYWMAEIYEEMVEKVVIVSTGIGCTEEQKNEQLNKIGRNPLDLLLPNNAKDLRFLVHLSIYKFDLFKWVPDFILYQFVQAMGKDYRKEKQELVEHLLHKRKDFNLPIIKQETLLIWGDKDKIFPLPMAYQLQGHLGSKSKLEIIKDTGHAANIESPNMVNDLITSFVLPSASS